MAAPDVLNWFPKWFDATIIYLNLNKGQKFLRKKSRLGIRLRICYNLNNNRVDGVFDSNLYSQLIIHSICNAYISPNNDAG